MPFAQGGLVWSFSMFRFWLWVSGTDLKFKNNLAFLPARRLRVASPVSYLHALWGERSVMRYALLLHGRLGGWDQSPSESLHARGDPHNASLRLMRFCAETHLVHIVRAVGAPVDVFIHTWNPELATFIDATYGEALRGSQHEPVHSALPKAQSQALSIGKVAALALRHGSMVKVSMAKLTLTLTLTLIG